MRGFLCLMVLCFGRILLLTIMLQVSLIADRHGDSIRFQFELLFKSGQIPIVGETMNPSAKFTTEGMGIVQFYRAEAGAPDMCQHDFAGNPVSAQGRHQRAVCCSARFANQVGIGPS